ncbi:MAG: cyclic nucleotide-binding domain-containing protein [Rectinemataceae bacterium]
MSVLSLIQSQPVQALWYGVLCSASLPLGAALGLVLRPQKRVLAATMAFGAGCLISALTLEIIAPAFHETGFFPVAAGAVFGGLLFVFFNGQLNGQGGFLRKPATAMRYLVQRKKARLKGMVDNLSHVDIFRSLPAEEMKSVIPFMNERQYPAGETVFNQGDAGDSLFMVESGEVEVIKNGGSIATMSHGESFGEMALLSGESRNATLRTLTPVKLWVIRKEDFDRLVKVSPRLFAAVSDLAAGRIQEKEEAERWKRQVAGYADSLSVSITDRDLREVVKEHPGSGAALAIWLGMLLDGIPESGLVGAGIANMNLSMALFAGIFLSNMPEAMSSAVLMRNQGKSVSSIMWLWLPLIALCGVTAVIGNILLGGASPVAKAIFDGCGAGAMLVVVAETMLPEAYEQGGAVVGLSTLAGFLVGLFVKSIA